jgi:hypothetical protein
MIRLEHSQGNHQSSEGNVVFISKRSLVSILTGAEIWYCDSQGFILTTNKRVYANPQTDTTTYLRGVQMTNSSGVATLLSIITSSVVIPGGVWDERLTFI